MCDNCMHRGDIMDMLELPEGAAQKAAKRLRCYYECVTRDEDIFDDEDDEEDDESSWLPPM